MSGQNESVGWLHSMAERPREQIEADATPKNRRALRLLCQTVLQTNGLPKRLSASEFADWVLRLRENDRSWSWALGDAILQAEEQAVAGNKQGAAAMLEQFADGCPWLRLKEVALVQRLRYL